MTQNLFNSALKYHQAGDLNAAEKIYHEILNNEPNNADVLHLLAILHSQKNDHATALSYLEKALQQAPNTPSFYNSLGNIYKNLGQIEDAIDAYHKAMQLNPNNASALNNLGNIYYQQGKFDEAIKHYQAAIKLRNNFADAHFNLGMVYLKQNQPSTAIIKFKEALDYDPQHFEANKQIGIFLQQQEKYPEAIKHYKICLQILPQAIEVRHNLAAALVKLHKTEEAIENFEAVLRQDPDHIPTLQNLGAIYLQANKLNQALPFYLRLVTKAPDKETYYNLGVIYMDKDHHQDAIIYFKEALKMDSYYLDAHLNIAATYLKLEDYDNAIKHYQTALEIQPDNIEIKYILAALTEDALPTEAPSEYLQHLFDQYAGHFDTHLLQHLNYEVPDLLYKAVTNYIGSETQDWNILDLGCGTGLCGTKFKKLSKKIIGVDISEKMLRVAKQKNIYDELRLENITNYLSNHNHYDLIISGDVFTYIGDLKKIFQLCKSSLKPNGLFAFTTEKTEQYPYQLQKSARYAHAKKYIEELAEQNHFNIICCDNAILRTQKTAPMEGYVYLLKAKPLTILN